jgi:WD40 repeat protein/energy-coupling factor transporter ATP-binding protein EcfA2
MRTEGLTTRAPVEMPTKPFPGLRPFEFGENQLFFGRDGQSDQIIRKLSATRFVAVVGTSGSGKSSLVRAGLLPDLFSGFMQGAGSHWRVALMRPGNDPLGALARALNTPDVFGSDDEENAALQTVITEATLRRGSLGLVESVRQNRMPQSESLLVVVDQFEELFRFARVTVSGEQYRYEAAAFVKLLLEAARQREQNIYVVLTMRSDFLGDCSIFWDLPEAINEGQYLVPRMTRDQRAEAITGPVAVCGGRVEQRLVNRLLNDMGDNPDLLPILQHALMRTWENWLGDHAEGEALDLRHYEAVGTMTDALSLHADEAFNELPDERARLIAEKVFKALTEKGEDNREVRRPTVLRDLCALTGATLTEVVPVLELFRREGRSFLMPPASVPLDEESLIDISHESLIRNWKRLREWVDDESQSAQIYTRLAETAVLHERNRAGLWRDPDLQLALDWRERTSPTPSWAVRYNPEFDSAMKFLDASVEARDAAALEEERRRRREMRRTRVAAVVFFFLFLLAVVVLLYASAQRSRAEEEAANSQRLLYASDMNLAQQAYNAGNIRIGRELLDSHAPAADDRAGFDFRFLWHIFHNEARTIDIGPGVQSADISGGKLVVTRVDSGVIELWDLETGESVKVPTGMQELSVAALSPDGTRLAFNGPSEKDVKLTNVTSPQNVFTLPAEQDYVHALVFSPAGKTLAIATSLIYPNTQKFELWDVSTPGRADKRLEVSNKSSFDSVVFSPDGNKFMTSVFYGGLSVWDAAATQPSCKIPYDDALISSSAVFSPDGKLLAVGRRDGAVQLWSASTCAPAFTLKGASASEVTSAAFSPDGARIAVAYKDKAIRLWDYPSGSLLATLWGHKYSVRSLSFLTDGRLASFGGEGSVKLWDAEAAIHEQTPLPASKPLSVAFSPDGKLLAVGGYDGRVVMWDAETRRQRPDVTLPNLYGSWAVAFSRDGRLFAATGGKRPRLWDARTFKELAPLEELDDQVTCLAISPDGEWLVSDGEVLNKHEYAVRLWRVGSAKPARSLTFKENVSSVAFSPDGGMVAAGFGDGSVRVWDGALTRELITKRVANETGRAISASSVAFSLDSRVIASGFENGYVYVWDAATGKKLYSFYAHSGEVTSVAFSPDGKTLAVGGGKAGDGGENVVTVWSSSSFKQLLALPVKGYVVNVAFSSDGGTLAAVVDSGGVHLWRGATDEEIRVRAPAEIGN